MLKLLKNFLFFVFRFGIVLVINFCLFIIIPLTHELFGFMKHDDKSQAHQTRIVAEYIKPPKKEEPKEIKRQIRKVSTSNSGQSGKKNMDFKFTPDLSTASASGEGVAMASEDLDALVFEEGQVDQDAELIGNPVMPYPKRAMEQGIEGEIIGLLIVGTEGNVLSVEIVTSPDPIMSKEAQTFFSKLKFKPASNQGVPVKTRIRQRIEFKLNS